MDTKTFKQSFLYVFPKTTKYEYFAACILNLAVATIFTQIFMAIFYSNSADPTLHLPFLFFIYLSSFITAGTFNKIADGSLFQRNHQLSIHYIAFSTIMFLAPFFFLVSEKAVDFHSVGQRFGILELAFEIGLTILIAFAWGISQLWYLQERQAYLSKKKAVVQETGAQPANTTEHTQTPLFIEPLVSITNNNQINEQINEMNQKINFLSKQILSTEDQHRIETASRYLFEITTAYHALFKPTEVHTTVLSQALTTSTNFIDALLDEIEQEKSETMKRNLNLLAKLT